MNTTFFTLNLFSALSFYGFGVACLTTQSMRVEFTRYGLGGYRVLTGWLQLLGASGLVLGIWLPTVGFAAALGISLQMLAGLGVRLRIRDKWLQCLPAAFYCILNGGLAAAYWWLLRGT